MSDPDGEITLELEPVFLPRPHSDEQDRDTRWYRYSYQLYGKATLTVTATATMREAVAGAPAPAPVVLSQVVQTLDGDASGAVAGGPGLGEWTHVEQQFGCGDNSKRPDGANCNGKTDWAEWSKIQLTVTVKCTVNAGDDPAQVRNFLSEGLTASYLDRALYEELYEELYSKVLYSPRRRAARTCSRTSTPSRSATAAARCVPFLSQKPGGVFVPPHSPYNHHAIPTLEVFCG